VSWAIPASIIATFNLMYFNGLTLNVMTLGGLALGGGMLVDNAIVVIESIFRNHELGRDRRDSIITGTSEVSGAIIASTLTTIVVFLPIVYIHGASGQLFKDQAWTVAFSLISSLFVALLVIPMMYDRLIGLKNAKIETRSLQIIWYKRLLTSFLKNRWLVICISALILLGTVLLLPFMGTEFLPRSGSQAFTVSVKLPEGTRLERTDAIVQNLEFLIQSISGDSLCVVYSHAGVGSSENEVFEGEHTAMIKVILSKTSPLPPDIVRERFVEATQNIEGLELTFKQDDNTLGSLFGDEIEPIVVEVKGENLDEIASITNDVLVRMESIEGIYNIKSAMADGAPELTVSINRNMAGINNISIQTVISQMQQQLQGRDVGKMEYKGEMRDILIKTPDVKLKDLQDIIIRSGNQEFLLREIATIESSLAPKEIFRRNQNRINKIVADKEPGISLDKAAQQIRQAVRDIKLLNNYSIIVTGEEEKRQESMQTLLWALFLSIALVYMVLASQFESLLHPFTILLTIPLGLIGSVLIFIITGTTINIMGVIGIIMMAGIAVNNSIILVVRINQLKTEMPLIDAVVQAGQQRIRPILMTSLTTILALLPMSINFGEGAALRSSMAMAVIGGLVTSTLMSLIVIPCVYYVFEQMKNSVKRVEN
jgi:HAE1 family hydrophobic/amphiphilic exporter-1